MIRPLLRFFKEKAGIGYPKAERNPTDWSHLDPSRIAIPPLPTSVNIELSSICNFKGRGGYCPLCAAMLTGGRPKGFMERSSFERLIDEISSFVKDIGFVGHGEPGAHPEVWELLSYASKKGIKTFMCTNGLTLNPKIYGRIIDANISRLDICLEGMTDEVHRTYRKGSDFYALIQAIAGLADLKKRGLLRTRLVVQTVALRTNEHQISDIAKWCEELGIHHRIQTASFGHDRISHQGILREKFEPQNPDLQRVALHRNPDPGDQRSKRIVYCPWAEKAMILHSGDVIKCCYDFEGSQLMIGNAFSTGSFTQVWEDQRHLDLLKAIYFARIPFCFQVTCDRKFVTCDTPEPGISPDSELGQVTGYEE
ncbi:MAG: radical SAM protein [Deltaproteobacteria bacterium]|nr:radical SAM protein [Deltaproteobacteria bacterium]